MIFGFRKRSKHHEISATELDAMMRGGRAMVIDVRQPDEFAAGHIPGAINLPLSSFQPTMLPAPGGKRLVLNCGSGKRSAMALARCTQLEGPVDTHLGGGFGAWQAAGLPIAR